MMTYISNVRPIKGIQGFIGLNSSGVKGNGSHVSLCHEKSSHRVSEISSNGDRDTNGKEFTALTSN